MLQIVSKQFHMIKLENNTVNDAKFFNYEQTSAVKQH